MKNYLVCLCITSFMIANAYADVYKWTDAQGTHFSDLPKAGATAVPMPVSTNPAPSATPADQNSNVANTNNASAAAAPNTAAVAHTYQSLTISQPQNNATIWDNSGNVLVTTNIAPALIKGDQVQILVDGKPAGSAQQNSVALTGIERGTHQVQAQILGSDGKVLISSGSNTIYLHQASSARH